MLCAVIFFYMVCFHYRQGGNTALDLIQEVEGTGLGARCWSQKYFPTKVVRNSVK